MALKNVIRKKSNPAEELKKLSETLGRPDLESAWPKKNTEPWRRYSPEKLIEPLRQAASTQIKKATPTLRSEGGGLKTLADWKTSDEIFYQKCAGALGKLPRQEESSFFGDLALGILEEELYVLRVARENTTLTGEIDWSEAAPGSLQVRGLLVYCESGSQAELYFSSKEAAFDISFYGIYQEANSHLTTQLLYELNGKNSAGTCYHTTLQERDARSRHGFFSIDTRTAKIFIQNRLEAGAEADYYGVHTGNHGHNDHDYRIHHAGSSSRSNVLFKMALLDNAYGIFWGDTVIDPGTTGCEGIQSNKNLILGKGSRVDAIPRLEILTEDVAASHGSATGELSEEELFYIMSRGLTEPQARNLLIRGFFEDLIAKAIGGSSDEDPQSPKERLAKQIREGIEKQLHLESAEA